MTETARPFLPAAGRDAFLPLYDPFTRLFGFDRDRRALLRQADLHRGHRVLDVGCGTGTFLVRLERQHPDVDAVGLDPDPKALARARTKARRAGVDLQLDQGFADAMPYDDATFDRVFSSFVIHHLDPADRVNAFREIRRVLEPGGRFLLADFAGPKHAGLLQRLVHTHGRLADNDEPHMLAALKEAGFEAPRVVDRRGILIGQLVHYEARRGLD